MKKLMKISLVLFFIFVFGFSNSKSAEQDRDLEKVIRVDRQVPSLKTLIALFIGKIKSDDSNELFDSFTHLVIYTKMNFDDIKCFLPFIEFSLIKMAIEQYGMGTEERQAVLSLYNPAINFLFDQERFDYLLSIQDLLDESGDMPINIKELSNGEIGFDFGKLSLTSIVGLESLESIDEVNFLILSYNNIKILTNSIMNLRELTSLDLEGNKLTDLQPELFVNLPGLERLNLSKNKIKELKNGVIVNCIQLKKIFLGDNPLEVIEPNAFIGTRSLKLLSVLDHKLTKESLDFLDSLMEERNVAVLGLILD